VRGKATTGGKSDGLRCGCRTIVRRISEFAGEPARLRSIIRRMLRLRLWFAGALTLPLIGGCDRILDPDGVPKDSGFVVPIAGACQDAFLQCVSWSPDSKILYVRSSAVLYAVDPTIGTPVAVGSVTSGRARFAAAGADRILYTSPEGPTLHGVFEMSTATGVSRRLASAGFNDFAVTTDGSAVVFHSNVSTTTVDTLVVLDVATATRRATSVSTYMTPRAVSPTAHMVLLYGVVDGKAAIQVWDVSAGTRSTSFIPAASAFEGAAWVENGFRILLRTIGSLRETDTQFGNVVAYNTSVSAKVVSWVPSLSSAFVVSEGGCFEVDGYCATEFRIGYATPDSTSSIGQFLGGAVGFVSASPDGKWLAFKKLIDGPPSIVFNAKP
jgi:hypothetical protein